jgi:2-polyprenyl-3-methyl-5-hydroxy-6-metoxy-1,4-benzoquinol methylase
MYNTLHALLHRPEKGWDPMPGEYAEKYAAVEWGKLNGTLIDQLEQQIDGFQGKRVLDLGGGPGQYSVAFAQRGAEVMWHDVSRNYMRIAERHAATVGVKLKFSLGYMEEAKKFIAHPFDLVFNRICWYYCRNDWEFARLIYGLVKPGGAAYIDTNNTEFADISGRKKIIYFLSNRLAWKVGHPFPPRGRIARLLHKYPIDYMTVDYTTGRNDRIFFVKSNKAPNPDKFAKKLFVSGFYESPGSKI